MKVNFQFIIALFIIVIFSTKILAGNYVFSVKGTKTVLNNQEILIAGLCCSNALYSEESTNNLIYHLDEYKTYGVNTVSVFIMGLRY